MKQQSFYIKNLIKSAPECFHSNEKDQTTFKNERLGKGKYTKEVCSVEEQEREKCNGDQTSANRVLKA